MGQNSDSPLVESMRVITIDEDRIEQVLSIFCLLIIDGVIRPGKYMFLGNVFY